MTSEGSNDTATNDTANSDEAGDAENDIRVNPGKSVDKDVDIDEQPFNVNDEATGDDEE